VQTTSRSISALATIVVVICLLPLVGVFFAAISGSVETLQKLAETVLWRYTRTTLVLVLLVGIGCTLIDRSPHGLWSPRSLKAAAF